MRRFLVVMRCLLFLVPLGLLGCVLPVEYKGGTYTGELVNGVLRGQGTFTFDKGTILGEWIFDKPWKAVLHSSSGKCLFSYKEGVPQI